MSVAEPNQKSSVPARRTGGQIEQEPAGQASVGRQVQPTVLCFWGVPVPGGYPEPVIPRFRNFYHGPAAFVGNGLSGTASARVTQQDPAAAQRTPLVRTMDRKAGRISQHRYDLSSWIGEYLYSVYALLRGIVFIPDCCFLSVRGALTAFVSARA